MVTDDSDDGPVGYRQPPTSTQFRKGKSGNPKGRPRGRKTASLYEAVLGQRVTVRERGVERRIRADEAFLLYMTNQGLKGDIASSHAILDAMDRVRALRGGDQDSGRVFAPFCGDDASDLQALQFGRKYDPFRKSTYVKLNPWIVQAALDRLGDRRLSPEEQDVVINATRTPPKVRWPDWWEVTKPDPDHHRKYCEALRPNSDASDAYWYYHRKPGYVRRSPTGSAR